ncbi:hypothetical protein QTP81_17090 [Alteromonas sp. ASW11-36]|uniref:Fis family transcriptional regulator n=1 Tax=Alteromonas arenosi TaxID=3055817 RepID=A0ABT7T1K1_9ALTE|nr:hypothetical protein [Alteromonas sp. ASW11-36]MDM7862326.1 hypothetical protein [Alteromonas sp. ASW11-36]
MDPKAYIDEFACIAHLPREQQFKEIEAAIEAIKQDSALPVLPLISIAIPAIVVGALVAMMYLFFGGESWTLVIAAIFGLLVSRVIASELRAKLLNKALHKRQQVE